MRNITMRLTRFFCLVLCASFSLTDMAFSADNPKLKQGMNLNQARKAIISSGWMVSNRSKCLTHSGLRDNPLPNDCIELYSDEFYLNFPEYDGASLNASEVWGVYKDGYGKCLEVVYGYSEEFSESKALAKHISVDFWKTKDCEE